MELHPKLNLDSFEASFLAVDTHTVGEFTRIVVSGFPKRGKYNDRESIISPSIMIISVRL